MEITVTEMRLLSDSSAAKAQVLMRDQLLQNAWGYLPNVTDRTVDSTCCAENLSCRGLLGNYVGVGYRWACSPEETVPQSIGAAAEDET